MGVLSGLVFVLVGNEIFAGIQAQRLIGKRLKLLKQDLSWLEADDKFSWSNFNDHMNKQVEDYPHLFLVPYVPPTFLFTDEREKYLESKTWVYYPQKEIKERIKREKLKKTQRTTVNANPSLGDVPGVQRYGTKRVN
jgi:hypothetical protein